VDTVEYALKLFAADEEAKNRRRDGEARNRRDLASLRAFRVAIPAYKPEEDHIPHRFLDALAESSHFTDVDLMSTKAFDGPAFKTAPMV
jgi:hypothetical protein